MATRIVFRTRTLALAALLLSPGAAQSSSFYILEQSPAQLGTAFAGTASNIEDASTVYFNPAGMSQLQGRQFTAGGNLIFTEADFNDRGSNTGGSQSGTDETGVVPNLYYIHPLGDALTLGAGVNAPFGLRSDYGREWIGRYIATSSELEVVNLNATLAYSVTEQLSFGLGLNYQRADVTLERNVDSTLGVSPDPGTDSWATIEGDDSDVTFDLSMHMQITDGTAVGAIWRQGADFSLEGSTRFDYHELCMAGEGFPTGAAPTTGTVCAGALAGLEGPATANLELPDILTVSVSHQIMANWELHGDIAWTQWDSIGTVDVINTTNDSQVEQLDLDYSNTLRYALGVTYSDASPWTWRAGVAWDEAPQTDPQRVTPRVPDGDRTWISAGVNYAFSRDFSVDAGYAHLFVDDVNIQDQDPDTGHLVSGNFDPTVDIIGVQANWRF